MNFKKRTHVRLVPGKNALLIIGVLALSIGCQKSNQKNQDLRDFSQVNLVANSAEYSPKTIDRTLINAFGISWSPSGTAWVNSVGGHVSELYSAEGDTIKRVNIPSPTEPTGGFPCGIVFSGSQGFNLPNGPSLFLFSGFDGVLSGWNPASGNNAQLIKHPPNASYTGLALATNGRQNLVYAANFGQKKIDVWDTAFKKINLPFKDSQLPDEYSPYNIQAVGNQLFVMFAKLDTTGSNKGHGVAGAGFGFVDIFNPDGTLAKRFATRGSLNIPWGVTMAPGSFLDNKNTSNNGPYATKSNSGNNDNTRQNPDEPVILVGNFGDGRINVFTQNGDFIGQLQSRNRTIVIDGLWALSFAPASSNVDPSRLYFTAGPEKETDGIFGYLKKQ